MGVSLRIPVSAGELLDRITILEIKSERISDPAKLANVRAELELLDRVWTEAGLDNPEVAAQRARLRQVNETLWEIEDDIRAHEIGADFGDTFVKLARAVYRHNDERAAIKRDINLALGSEIIEEKSYPAYD